MLGTGADREQREHQHQPQLILSVPGCLSQAGSGAKDYRRNNLAHPCPEGVWVAASQSSPCKQPVLGDLGFCIQPLILQLSSNRQDFNLQWDFSNLSIFET